MCVTGIYFGLHEDSSYLFRYNEHALRGRVSTKVWSDMDYSYVRCSSCVFAVYLNSEDCCANGSMTTSACNEMVAVP